MLRKLALVALLLVATGTQARAGFGRTLGTVGITDNFVSVFALNSNRTWVGLPNANGAPSFIAYSLFPPVSYTAGYWRYDPRIPAVNLYGTDGTALATLNGLAPGIPTVQYGTITGWHAGPTPTWSFLP
jgi:hypothetical protein